MVDDVKMLYTDTVICTASSFRLFEYIATLRTTSLKCWNYQPLISVIQNALRYAVLPAIPATRYRLFVKCASLLASLTEYHYTQAITTCQVYFTPNIHIMPITSINYIKLVTLRDTLF